MIALIATVALVRSPKQEAEIRFMLLTYNAPGGKEIARDRR
jgi:hypothetical protein